MINTKFVAARVKLSTRSTICELALAMTKDSSVSSTAIVEMDDGKNCGVSVATINPWSEPIMRGDAGLSEIPMILTPCSRAMRTASTTSWR